MKRICFLLGLALLASHSLRAETALQFTLSDLDGGEFSLEKELQQGPIVFDFWATWCKPCIKGLPKIQQIATEYKERGVRVYTINIDGPRNLAKIRPFLKRYKLDLPVLLDKTNALMKQFHFVAPPATLVVGQKGEVVYKHQGYKSGDEMKLRHALDEMLKDKAGEE